MQKKKKKVIHKGNYQWSLCAMHRNLVTIEGNTWPVAIKILNIVVFAIPKLSERAL